VEGSFEGDDEGESGHQTDDDDDDDNDDDDDDDDDNDDDDEREDDEDEDENDNEDDDEEDMDDDGEDGDAVDIVDFDGGDDGVIILLFAAPSPPVLQEPRSSSCLRSIALFSPNARLPHLKQRVSSGSSTAKRASSSGLQAQ
jgi:hypothetical protein